MTDIIRPFWAIPLLSVARLNFHDIMGYCSVIFLVYLVISTWAFFPLPCYFKKVGT